MLAGALLAAWVTLMGGAALAVQEVSDLPVRLLQAQTDSIFAADSASFAGPKRYPEWDIPEVRPIAENPEWLREARACLRTAGEEEVDIPRRWYLAKRIVFFPPQSPAEEYYGLQFRSGGVSYVLVRDYEGSRRTLVHEAVHALCEDGCPHDRTQIATTCGWRTVTIEDEGSR